VIELDLFPSRTLALYLSRLFITRILGTLVMLVVVLQLLDLLGESGHILAHKGNGEAQLWTYVTLRAPQLVARFLPYSVLLATLFTFFPLNQNSEIIAMRAAGLSAHQILAPMLATAMVVSGVSFTFNETVVTHVTGRLKAWEAVDYGVIQPGSATRSNVYVADGHNILYVESLANDADGVPQMTNVTWYLRDADGRITGKIDSPSATYARPGWKLAPGTSFDVATATQSPTQAQVVAPKVTPAQLEIAKVDADGMNIFQLTHAINSLRASGRPTAELTGKWWHKFSGPLAALLMPLLGAVAAFGLARSGALLIRAIVGMGMGFAYFVLDNAALAIGNFGGYPPLIAAWAPFFLFLFVGETVLIKTEE
jgi:lipopolysaccharide export system permease protein